MWYLTSSNDSRVLYVVLPNQEISIGRSADAEVCNFAIPDDPSISRKHASLSISDNKLFLQDLGSRYGTHVNERSMESNSKVQLNAGDVVKFGKMLNIWTVHNVQFTTCTSTLKGENLQNLKSCLDKLGGILKNEWDDSCTYLTMPAITLTIKVVLALVQGSHIVTTEFWSKCLEAINNQTQLPKPSNFTPSIVESTLNKEIVSFLPDEKRRKLFTGKSIYFFSRRQFDMYKPVLVKGSATAILLSEAKVTKSMLCAPDVIVIQYNLTNVSQETQTQRNQINDIVNHLKTKGKRVVADAEIGLAMLYCSTEKYCNPDFNFTSEVIKPVEQNAKMANVLAGESQEPRLERQNKENVVINESLIANNGTPTSKRKMSDDDPDTNASKKLATGQSFMAYNESSKRKHPDDETTMSNPTKKVALDGNEQNPDDEFFNFIHLAPVNSDTQDQNAEKKLNLVKPIKRKPGLHANDDDDLFNFVEDSSKNANSDTPTHSIFDTNRSADNAEPQVKKIKMMENSEVNVSELRGSKLDELLKMNNESIPEMKKIKQEINDELQSKMNDLALGTTIVKIKPELVIKRESLLVESTDSPVKNFKKFKKVWPLKMQVTIIPKSSMNVTTAVNCSSLNETAIN